MTVVPLFPRCGTYDCSKLAVGSVLTSPNARIMEQQRSVNDWIRGTAASSSNFFFLMISLTKSALLQNSDLHSLHLTKRDGALAREADDKTKQTEEKAHLSLRMVRQQRYSEIETI